MVIPTNIGGISTAIIAAAFFLAAVFGWPMKFGKHKTLVMIASGAIFFIGGGLSMLGVSTPSVLQTGAVAGATASLDCGDVTSVTESIRVLDAASSTLAYTSPVYYFQRVKDNVLEETGTATSSTYATETLDPCETYKVFSISTAGSVSASNADTFTTGKLGGFHDIKAYNMSTLQLRVKDVQNDEYEQLFNDDLAAGTNATTYTTNVNTTRVYEDAAAADIAIGADGKLEAKILLKATTVNTFATDPTLKWWICIDEGIDGEWKSDPSVAFDGVKLTNSKASMDVDSLTGSIVQAADWCYPVTKAVDDTEHTIDLIVQADAGQNPDTTNDDVTVSFLSEGTYVSTDVLNTVKTGVYTDAATQVLAGYDSTRTPRIVFQIS